MSRDAEIREFLRRKRASLRPEDVGLDVSLANRRVPGLRRDEVAVLAGISTDYYIRLEQGRDIRPSDSVLDAVARALRLNDAERTYLFALVQSSDDKMREAARDVQRVRPGIHRLLASWNEPALVIGRRTDVLAANVMGCALVADFDSMPVKERNHTRWLLLDPAARERYRDWEKVASEMTAELRFQAGKWPDDPRITQLVGELTMKSPEFRNWWSDHQVMAHTYGIKRFRHPVVGDLDVEYEALMIPGEEDQAIFIYTTEPGSASAETLGLLASWSATGA